MTTDERRDIPDDPEVLRHEYIRLRQLLDLAPCFFYVLDYDGRFHMANDRVAELYGSTVKEIVGRRLADIVPSSNQADRLLAEVREVLDSNSPRHWPEIVVSDANGVDHPAELHDIPYVDPQTGERRLLGVATDLTERKKLEEHQRQNERMMRDFEIARSIQESLLPDSPPDLAGFEIGGWSQAAHSAGGDHYDWMPLPDGRLIATIADVTGHGIGPAIVTAVCRAYARATLGDDEPLEYLLMRLNKLLYADLPVDRFVTFAVAILDPAMSYMQLLSAGHGPILIYRSARHEIERIETHGPPLALDEHLKFEPPTEIRFDHGDMLVLVSDGLWEWANKSGDQFGLERLDSSILKHAATNSYATPDTFIDALRQDVVTFVEQTPQPDDITAVVIRRT